MIFNFARNSRIILTGFLLFAFTPYSFAQDKDARLELFEGGNMNVSVNLRSSLLTGAGVTGTWGGVIAPVAPDPFVIFGNPAALARINERKIGITSAPTVELDIMDLSDPTETISTEVDARLESFEVKPGSKTYPVMTGTFSRSGSLITGFALALPVTGRKSDGRWFGGRIPKLFDRIAFGYYEPLVLHTSVIYSGLRTRLRTISDTPENEILFYASIKMDADIKIEADSWNASVARQVGNSFWVGLGVQRTAARIEIHGNQRTDGIMSKAGAESAFNDPTSPWDDDYFAKASGAMNGASWGTRLGALYSIGDKLLIGAMARVQTKMEMDADMELDLHTFKALNFTAPEGEKKFNVNSIEDVSELTKTYGKSYVTASTMQATIPGELSVSATFTRFLKPTVTYTKYFGELAYKYDIEEDGGLHTYKRGVKPDWGANFGLDISLLKFSVGVVSLADVVGGYHDARSNPIPSGESQLLPRMSMGFTTGLSDHLKLGVLLVGLPEDAFRFSLEYTL